MTPIIPKLRAAITGITGFVPEYCLTNSELETLVDTTNEWILERTGIEERRILRNGAPTSSMAVTAITELLQKTQTDASEIDLLICATVTPDHVFPATANIISDVIGAKNAWSFDLKAACSGFLYGLTVGAQFIETGRHKKILVVGADKMSSIIDYQDRNTCIIFGDGAGAVLLEPNAEGYGLIDFVLKSDGSGKQYLFMKAGGSAYPPSLETVINREHFVYQEGKPVFRHAVYNMAEVAAEIMERNGLTSEDIAYLVPHQANKRIIMATAERMGIGEEKVMINIQRYGNTTAGTIPLCLWEWESKLKKGDNLVLAGFGAGFTWGAIYLRWGYDG